jgi:hypothetical protein
VTRAQILVAVVGGLVGLSFAVGLFLRFGAEQGTPSRMRGFAVLSDTAVRIDVEVARDPGSEVFCVVRARELSGTEVGRKSFDVPSSGPRTTVVSTVLRTSRRPVGGELVGCAPGRARSAP